jgi:hypothetical protein
MEATEPVKAFPSLSGAHSRTASQRTGTKKQDPRGMLAQKKGD